MGLQGARFLNARYPTLQLLFNNRFIATNYLEGNRTLVEAICIPLIQAGVTLNISAD